VVTHGVGSQRRVDQLDDVVEPLVEFLCRVLGPHNVHLEARTQTGDDLNASAIITLDLPGDRREAWHVREAWWAESFRPSASGAVLAWAVRAAANHVKATTGYVVVRHVEKLTGKRPRSGEAGIWGGPPLSRLRGMLDLVIWGAITVGYFAVYLIGAVLILPLYIVLLLPFWVLFPAGIGRLQQALVNVLTGGIGDQHATTNRYVAVAGAADTVVSALWNFLAPDRPHRGEYETVTLIAHSGGCVVSYVALNRGDVQAWLRDSPAPRRVTWITVGSGLNLAYRMQAERKERDKVFWARSLRETVNWIDIYARYDPVPQGEPPGEMVRKIVGDEPGRPYASVRVVNHELPFTDHGAYWGNHEEVMSRIVHAIADSRLGRGTVDMADPTYAQQRNEQGNQVDHPLAAGIAYAVSRSEARRNAVTRNRFLSIVALIVGVGLLAWWGPLLGGWVLGDGGGPLPATWLTGLRQWIGEHTPAGLGPFAWGGQRSRFVGTVVLIALVYTALLIARLGGALRAWKAHDPRYPPLPEADAGEPQRPTSMARPARAG
jgi:hypothetical protein